jgi:vancomycin resistance protein YoaR
MGSGPVVHPTPVRSVTLVRGQPRPISRRRFLPRVILAAPLILAVLLAAMLTAQRGQIYPGVAAGTVELGGLSPQAAEAKVARAAAAFARQPITLTAGDQRWALLPAELGISYDANGTVRDAMAVGRGGDTPAGLLRLLRLAGGQEVPVALSVNTQTFNAYLDKVEATIPGRMTPPTVTIDGTTATIVPGHNGLVIDRDAVLAAIRARAGHTPTTAVTLSLHTAEATGTAAQADAARATIERALAAPMKLTGAGADLQITPRQLAPIIRVTPVHRDGHPELAVTLDDAGLAKLSGEIAKQADRPVADAYVQDFPSHSVLMPSVAGLTVDRAKLGQAVRDAFAAGKHEVTVPAVTTAPKVTTEQRMAKLGITDVIAKGTSDFSGSGPARAHNVRLAAYLVDGTLIAPGGTFSYNDALGSIFAKDFEEAGSYIDGLNGSSLGGGVCQVSTTVFRAALKGGLPITEWYPHTYRTGYYEQGGWSEGFDAAIVQDGNDPSQSSDLKFVNPTDTWMLLRVTVGDDMTLTATLYGVPTGYTVAIDDPVVQVTEPAPSAVAQEVDPDLPAGTVIEDQPAMDGTEVTVVRHVYDAKGNEVSTDTFVSDYRPTGAVDRVSSDMASQ